MDGSIDIWMSGYDNLKKCFELANDNHNSYCGFKVVSDKEHGTRMFLYWYKNKGLLGTKTQGYLRKRVMLAGFLMKWMVLKSPILFGVG